VVVEVQQVESKISELLGSALGDRLVEPVDMGDTASSGTAISPSSTIAGNPVSASDRNGVWNSAVRSRPLRLRSFKLSSATIASRR
jgi:hypothetical protein